MKFSKVYQIFLASICLFILTSCVTMPPPPEDTGGGCGWSMAAGDTTTGLGAADWNAGYMGIPYKARPGDRLMIKGEFPHARYMSIVLYDQDFLPIGSISDVDIVPHKGENPFLPGTDRTGKYLGRV